MQDSDSHETFFAELNTNFDRFFDMGKDTFSNEEQSQLYPLQEKLHSTEKRYTNPERVGEGSKKCIYKVMDTITGRPVAKAVLKDAVNKDVIEQFICEARLTSLLEHPNIIPIYDMGLEDGEPFFTMELMKGNMLSQIIKELNVKNPEYLEKYPPRELLDIFSRICDAMAYAHSIQVIHLDLKPENIHVGEFGEVLICDWGLAKIITDEDPFECEYIATPNEFNNMTLKGQIKGTPGFMAPEQCLPNKEKDTRTDIYALGAILYSMLTYSSSISFSADVKDILQKTIHGDIIPPSLRKPMFNIPQRLETIVMKALACEPDLRYQTISELRTDLSKYLRGYATTAENASFITHAVLLIKRHILTSSILTGFIVVLTILTLAFIGQLTTKERNAVTAQQRAELSLEQLQSEMKENQKLNNDIVKLFMDNVTPVGLNSEGDIPAVIERALQTDINANTKDALWFQKGLNHFINQEFNQASESFLHCSRKFTFRMIVRTCRETAQLKPDDSSRMQEKQLADIIMKLSRSGRSYSFPLYEAHIKYQHAHGIEVDPEQRLPLIIAMLSAANNRWKESITTSRLKKIENGYSLNLSGTNFRTFHPPQKTRLNILAPLKLTSLDLSNSAFFELVELRGLYGLTTLNISGCNIPLLSMKECGLLRGIGVKKLIIDTEKIPTRALNMLRRNMNVIDAKEYTKQ